MKLGNLVEIITTYTGIKWLVKKIWVEDCGCDERKKQLNKLFPYVRQFTEDEIKIYEEVLPRLKGGRISGQDQAIMIRLYNKVFNKNKKASGCTSCVKETLQNLEKVYDNSCKTDSE